MSDPRNTEPQANGALARALRRYTDLCLRLRPRMLRFTPMSTALMRDCLFRMRPSSIQSVSTSGDKLIRMVSSLSGHFSKEAATEPTTTFHPSILIATSASS